MRRTTIALGVLLAVSGFGPAMALPVAYLYVQKTGDAAGDPAGQLVSGLGNCLGLTESYVDGVVVRLECDDLKYMSKALTDIAEKPGVKSVSTWMIQNQ